jgi:hypothetical protein
MAFELQTRPVAQRLAEAIGGTTVELRELDYGTLTAAMRDNPDRMGEAVLARALYVDGEPFGLPNLLALPGRFANDIASALKACSAMHGMGAVADDDAPKP